MPYERLIDKNTPPEGDPTAPGIAEIMGSPFAGSFDWLRRFLAETYQIEPFWQYGGPRYGWNLQHRKGGRPLCEMYPEHGSFTAMVVLGKAEMEQALSRLDSFGPTVRRALTDTPRYHDGCWMYTRISDPATCQNDAEDIAQLVLIKKKPPKKKTA